APARPGCPDRRRRGGRGGVPGHPEEGGVLLRRVLHGSLRRRGGHLAVRAAGACKREREEGPVRCLLRCPRRTGVGPCCGGRAVGGAGGGDVGGGAGAVGGAVRGGGGGGSPLGGCVRRSPQKRYFLAPFFRPSSCTAPRA